MMTHADTHGVCVPRTVRIGGLTREALHHALMAHAVPLNRAAQALFADPRFTTLEHPQVVEIAAISVEQLGFGTAATYSQLVAAAQECGWHECPLELAPHLRLQYLDQPDSGDGKPLTHGRAPPGSLTVASPPLDETDETPKGFYLRRVDGAPWLRGYWSWPGHLWSPGDTLLFTRGNPLA